MPRGEREAREEARRRTFKQVVAIAGAAALLAVALGVRLYGASDRSLWLDEAYSVWNARGIDPYPFLRAERPFRHADWERAGSSGGLLAGVRDTENTPPLHFLALRGWMALFGSSAAAVRSLSAVAGVLTVLALLIGLRGLLGAGTAWAAAWLLALSPMHIAYCHEGRNYALSALLATLLLILFLQIWVRSEKEAPRRVLWGGYALLAALGLYANYLVALILVVHGLALLIGKRPFRSWMLAGAAAGLLFLPWLLYHVTRTAEAPLMTDPAWRALAVRLGAKLLVYLFLGETSLRALFRNLWFLSLPAVAILASAAIGMLRGERSPRRDAARIAAGTVAVYLAGIAALCLARQTWLLVSPRYSVLIVPALCLAVAAGAFSRRRGGAAIGMALTLLYAALLFTPVSALAQRPAEDWRQAAATIRQGEQPGDLVLFDGPPGAIPFNLYYHGLLDQLPLVATGGKRSPAPGTMKAWPRVWVVRSYEPVDDSLLTATLTGFRPGPAAPCGPNLTVSLWTPREKR